MVLQEQATQTEQIHNQNCGYSSLTSKNMLRFISSLILPLMLGIFTVVITFEQQKIARQQRLEDKNESRLQREQDKNESRLQRDQDWNIAQMAQTAQNKAITERYQDEIFVAYIKEVGDLLEKKDGILTSDSLIHTLARVKTLNTIRQLDGTRQIHILRFLQESGQLTNTNEYTALDISTAELTDIDFRKSGRLLNAGEISLAGIYLVNSTFGDISEVNLSFAEFDNVNFSFAELLNVNFSYAWLENVNFLSAEFDDVKFLFAELLNVNFSSARLENVDFLSARFENVKFSSAELHNVHFSPAERLYDVNFSSAWLNNVSFSSIEWFENVNFSSARLYYVSFSSTQLSNINFSSAEFRNVDFSSAECNFGLISFNRVKMSGTIFEKCHFQRSDFSYANLKSSSFRGATWTEANFSFTNLQNADLSETTITDGQLQSALSIRNAKLPNGTLGEGRNLVKNGDANCNISLIEHWHVHNRNIAVVAMKEDSSQCQFSVRSMTTIAMMSQRITLVDIWDSSFWTSSTVELQAQMSSGVSVELMGRNSNGTVLSKRIANATVNKKIMKLEDMHELEIVVKFNVQQNENSWCDNIELFIDYDTTPIYA